MSNINGKEDRYWTVEEIRQYVIEYLKEKFPDSIIMREFNKVDIMVLGPNIPVEIQKIYMAPCSTPNISRFENDIRKQIEQNIEVCEQCWLFFDDKLLYHLQNNLSRNVSINMDWLYQFYKSGNVKVFTITIDGIIRELEDKDFDFISKFSSTYKINKEEEYRILQMNKYKIAFKVLKGQGFTTDDITNWYNEYEKDVTKTGSNFSKWLTNRGHRRKILSYILDALGDLMNINEMLKCNMKDNSNSPLSRASALRIIEGRSNSKYSRIRCSDYDNVLEYFPGYFEKKELWDYWRTHTVGHKTFYATVRGEFDYIKYYKNQKSIEDAWN